jgi:hypothetical protein
MAKLPLRHYFWLRTPLLPGPHAEIGDRLRHWPGGVLRLLTQDKRLAHRTVLPDFVAGKRALLVLNPTDLRVLHLLKIEAYQLHADCTNRADPL